MPRGQLTKDIIKCDILKIKKQLDNEQLESDSKSLVHQYINKVLNKIEEYRY